MMWALIGVKSIQVRLNKDRTGRNFCLSDTFFLANQQDSSLYSKFWLVMKLRLKESAGHKELPV